MYRGGGDRGARSRVVERRPAIHLRVRAGCASPHNWVQLLKFCAVGASGYVVNLCVFALGVEVLDAAPPASPRRSPSSSPSLNNFWWNRHWTFSAGDGHAGFQAARFFTVSLVAFAFDAAVLELLVSRAGMPELPAQAISIVGRDAAQLRREQDVELRDRALARLTRSLPASLAAVPARRVGPRPRAADLTTPASDDRCRRSSSSARARGQGDRGAHRRRCAPSAQRRPHASRPPTRRATAAGR